MQIEKVTSKLIDYREGNLTKEQIREVEQQLKNDEKWQELFEELKSLDRLMKQAPIHQPSVKLKQRFEALLETERKKQPKTRLRSAYINRTIEINKVRQIAAAIALLIIGVGIGVQWKNNAVQQTEIAALRAEMLDQKKLLALSLLKQPSASDRIKGVNISLKETSMDNQILTALIERMNLDKNINVKLKAIEGLAQFGNNEIMITALIKALNNQQSPEVQIAIMEILVVVKAKAAYPKFQEILQDKKTIDAVKDRAASGLEILL